VERVLILDWDVHHGNGTNDIFHAADDVLFVSIHEWPLYPGTGPASDLGSRPRARATPSTSPCRRGAGDETYGSLVGPPRVPADRDLGAAARAGLGGVRRAPARPAGRLPRDRGRLCGDDRVPAPLVRGGRGHRWAWCWRVATRSRR
jgi:hypothetical protein